MKEVENMRYLVDSDVSPIPPEMAEAALAMADATEDWMKEEKKAGRIVEMWAKTDGSGGIILVEAESNDELFKKLTEMPFSPFLQFCVTPLTDMETAMEGWRQQLKRMAGK